MSSAVEAAAGANGGGAAGVVDTEALLAPLAGANPSGENLRHSEVYDRIESARESDDGLEKGEWQGETKTADWRQVEALSADALAQRTKDLRLCAWMTEALVVNHGFAGLRDGLRVMRGLHERFWETLYPEIDRGETEEVEDGEEPTAAPEEDLTARANALTLLDRLASAALRDVPLTQSRAGFDYSFTQWEGSKGFVVPEDLSELDPSEVERVEAVRAEAAAEGKITSEDWNKAKAATPFGFYADALATLDECRAELQALNRVVDERYGQDAPGLRALEQTLEEIRAVVERTYREKRPPEAAGDGRGADVGGGMTEAQPGGASVASAAGSFPSSSPLAASADAPVRTREEALRKLAEVADYFRRAEPHSPVSYLVQRAIRWGQMPLEAWLADVVKDPGVLESMRETLGLKSADGGAVAPEGGPAEGES